MNPLNIFINLFKKGDGATEAKKEIDSVKEASQEAAQEAERTGSGFQNIAGVMQRTLSAMGVPVTGLSRLLLTLAGSIRTVGTAIGVTLSGGLSTIVNVIAAAVGALAAIWSSLKDGEDQTKKTRDSIADLGTSQDGLKDKTADLATATAEAKAREDELLETLKRSRDAASNYSEALETLEAAKKKQAVANLDLLRSQGKISEEDYDIQRTTIETGSAIAALDRQRAEIERQISEKRKEFSRIETDATRTSVQEKQRADEFRAAGGDESVDYEKERKAAGQRIREAFAAQDAAQARVERERDRQRQLGTASPEFQRQQEAVVAEAENEKRVADEAVNAAGAEARRLADLADRQKRLAAARKAAEDARSRLDRESPIIDREVAGLDRRREAVNINIESERTSAAARINEANARGQARVERENERIEREQEAGWKRWEEERAKREKSMPPDRRVRRLVNEVQPLHRTRDGALIGEDVGRATQQQAQAAIQEAGQRIQSGENDARVIEDLTGTLQRLGAVLGRLDLQGLKRQLDLLDGKVELLESQTRNGRE